MIVDSSIFEEKQEMESLERSFNARKEK